MSRLRALAAATATAAVLATSALVAPAQAAPAPPPPTTSQKASDDGGWVSGKVKLSKNVTTQAMIVAKGINDATTRKSGKIDWKKAKKSFGKHTSIRDGVGAGWWYETRNWKRFKNISKADKKSIIKWSKTHAGPNPTLKVVPGASLRRDPVQCTGVTQWKDRKKNTAEHWLNSCDTDRVISQAGRCAPAGAVIAAAVSWAGAPPAGVVVALMAFACWEWKERVTFARDHSTVRGIIQYLTPGLIDDKTGKYTAPYKIRPQ